MAARHDTIRSVLSTLAEAPPEQQPALARTLASELTRHQKAVQTQRVADGRVAGGQDDLDAALDLARRLTTMAPSAGGFESTRDALRRAWVMHVEDEERRLREQGRDIHA